MKNKNFPIEKMMWTSTHCGGSPPSPRFSHAAAILETDADRGQMWIFGGRTGLYGQGVDLNDLFVLQMNAKGAGLNLSAYGFLIHLPLSAL
jgi:hypothetical protein